MINDRFLKACRREPVDCTPVWFMRQAGRYMAEYRALRAKHSILELCKTPELAAQVTLQPIDRFPLDAAIIFADILLPLEPMGLSLEFAAGAATFLLIAFFLRSATVRRFRCVRRNRFCNDRRASSSLGLLFSATFAATFFLSLLSSDSPAVFFAIRIRASLYT